MRTETLGNTSDNAIKEYSSPFTDIDYSKNKIISVRIFFFFLLHRHRLQQEQNNFGAQFHGLTGTQIQTLTLLLLLQAIAWMPDAKGSYATHAYLTLICACMSHTQVQILPLLLLQASVWMPDARASSLPVYLLYWYKRTNTDAQDAFSGHRLDA